MNTNMGKKGMIIGLTLAIVGLGGIYSNDLIDRKLRLGNKELSDEVLKMRQRVDKPVQRGVDINIPYGLEWLGNNIMKVGEISYEQEMERFVDNNLGLIYQFAPEDYTAQTSQSVSSIRFQGKMLPASVRDCVTNLLYSIGLSPDVVNRYVSGGKCDLTEIVREERRLLGESVMNLIGNIDLR